ncbi:MAG: response regulator [Myxococcota bacterium]
MKADGSPSASMDAPAVGGRLRPRVLVADDDGDMLRLIERALRRRGLQVDLAPGGRQALHRLARAGQAPPDLLVSDVQMPDVGGVDLLAWLRNQGLHVPVILVTAYPHDELAERAERLGAFEVLPKPFLMDRLYQLVTQALEERRAAP